MDVELIEEADKEIECINNNMHFTDTSEPDEILSIDLKSLNNKPND